MNAHRDHAVKRPALLLAAFSVAWAAAAGAQTPRLAPGVDTLRPGSVEAAAVVRLAAEPRSFRIVAVPSRPLSPRTARFASRSSLWAPPPFSACRAARCLPRGARGLSGSFRPALPP